MTALAELPHKSLYNTDKPRKGDYFMALGLFAQE